MSEDTLHDLNFFPKERGMLVFGISLSRISNSQSAQHYFEFLEHLDKKIQQTEGIGATFLYADYLYMLTDEGTGAELRAKYVAQMSQHKNQLLSLLKKDPAWVRDYFTFITHGQVLLNASTTLPAYLEKILEFYNTDDELKKCVVLDSRTGSPSTEQAHFILEESLLFYLASKGVISYPNPFINHREEWVLHCYPGKPLATETYLYQKNLFKLDNPKNRYENSFYDLEEKKLYNFNR